MKTSDSKIFNYLTQLDPMKESERKFLKIAAGTLMLLNASAIISIITSSNHPNLDLHLLTISINFSVASITLLGLSYLLIVIPNEKVSLTSTLSQFCSMFGFGLGTFISFVNFLLTIYAVRPFSLWKEAILFITVISVGMLLLYFTNTIRSLKAATKSKKKKSKRFTKTIKRHRARRV